MNDKLNFLFTEKKDFVMISFRLNQPGERYDVTKSQASKRVFSYSVKALKMFEGYFKNDVNTVQNKRSTKTIGIIFSQMIVH